MHISDFLQELVTELACFLCAKLTAKEADITGPSEVFIAVRAHFSQSATAGSHDGELSFFVSWLFFPPKPATGQQVMFEMNVHFVSFVQQRFILTTHMHTDTHTAVSPY